MVDRATYNNIQKQLETYNANLIAVSKKQSNESIQQLYDFGHRDFGESYVQELVQKKDLLPYDIRWHFIGHLQRNKVKAIAPFIHCIQSVDSFRLLDEIEKQAQKQDRTINVLLQFHIAQEESKFGFLLGDAEQVKTQLLKANYQHITICGLMGMATQTTFESIVTSEFQQLRDLSTYFQTALHGLSFVHWNTLSMGMSHDHKIALQAGSNVVRIGSLLFGERKN